MSFDKIVRIIVNTVYTLRLSYIKVYVMVIIYTVLKSDSPPSDLCFVWGLRPEKENLMSFTLFQKSFFYIFNLFTFILFKILREICFFPLNMQPNRLCFLINITMKVNCVMQRHRSPTKSFLLDPPLMFHFLPRFDFSRSTTIFQQTVATLLLIVSTGNISVKLENLTYFKELSSCWHILLANTEIITF